MKKLLLATLLSLVARTSFCWGFYAHQRINYYAVFLLPPQMLVFYKPNINFLSDHAVDPDKRRYLLAGEGPRHYIDLDAYGGDSLPERWDSAVAWFPADTLQARGIVPWWVQTMKLRLTNAFKERDGARILKLSAEIGHYVADAHVPLHASSNHDGQLTGQRGIHAFWESRLPELLAETEWDFFLGHAGYLKNTQDFIWKRVRESAAAADTVLKAEKALSQKFATQSRYSFEVRNGQVQRQYSSAYARAYDRLLGGMVERRMQASVFAVASFWYTAWVDAGQPDLSALARPEISEADRQEFEDLNKAWRGGAVKWRSHE